MKKKARESWTRDSNVNQLKSLNITGTRFLLHGRPVTQQFEINIVAGRRCRCTCARVRVSGINVISDFVMRFQMASHSHLWHDCSLSHTLLFFLFLFFCILFLFGHMIGWHFVCTHTFCSSIMSTECWCINLHFYLDNFFFRFFSTTL